MLNEVALVGRLTKNPEVTELEGGKKISSIIIAVPRMYKNSSGLYDTDYIRVTLWNGIALNTREYCHCGDLIGIKGRIQVNNFVDNDGKARSSLEIIAEKISFLSSKKEDDKSTCSKDKED